MSAKDAPDIFRAYWYLSGAGWRLFVLKRPVESWLAPRAREEVGRSEPDRAVVERAARWTNTIARYPFPWARCLQRSLAMCYWLEHKGAHPALRIGVRLENGKMDAHAWVEYGGKVVNDKPAVTDMFAVFHPGAVLGRMKFRRP